MAVKMFCRWLVAEGILKEDPSDAFKGPCRRTNPIGLIASVEEAKLLLEHPLESVSAFPVRDRLILELLYGSGLRADECANIQVSDYLGEDVLRVSKGKGDKQRDVFLSDYALGGLARLPAGALAHSRPSTPQGR
jgi:site-specific recombinase XerD